MDFLWNSIVQVDGTLKRFRFPARMVNILTTSIDSLSRKFHELAGKLFEFIVRLLVGTVPS